MYFCYTYIMKGKKYASAMCISRKVSLCLIKRFAIFIQIVGFTFLIQLQIPISFWSPLPSTSPWILLSLWMHLLSVADVAALETFNLQEEHCAQCTLTCINMHVRTHARLQQEWIFYFFNCSDASKYKFGSHADPSSAQYILWTYSFLCSRY